MSYMQDTIKCPNCGKYMNVAFGIVGMTMIAQWPEECGFCKQRGKFERIMSGWNATDDGELKHEEEKKENTG